MANRTHALYSAGLVSQSFWFSEMRAMLRLIAAGNTEAEIRRICLEENLFGMKSEHRILEVYRRMRARAAHLDAPMMQLFLSSDLSTQKLINLIAILRGDRLFFEFLYEVYREKAILGQLEMTDMDVNAFFTRKSAESEFVEGLSDATRKRLRSTYMNFLTDAGLLTTEGKRHRLTVPILDIFLERKLLADGEEAVIKAIAGVN